MLGEAVRLGFIGSNPSSKVRDHHESSQARGIRSLEEMAALFDKNRFAGVWGGNIPMLAANLLAASAGLHEGEIRALQLQDIHETSVSVVHSRPRRDRSLSRCMYSLLASSERCGCISRAVRYRRRQDSLRGTVGSR